MRTDPSMIHSTARLSEPWVSPPRRTDQMRFTWGRAHTRLFAPCLAPEITDCVTCAVASVTRAREGQTAGQKTVVTLLRR